MSNSKFNVNLITDIALMGALAFTISLIPYTFFFIAIEFYCIPILILALRRGLIAGIIGGLLWGILSIITGTAEILTLSQVLLEYILAPMSIGLAGIFCKKTKVLTPAKVLSGAFVGILVKFFLHFIAGVIFWSQYAWRGWGAVSYSLAINGISGILTASISFIILMIIIKKFSS